MKYIRTKDSIQAFDGGCDLSYVYQRIGGIKSADTIKELCDEFVVENPEKDIHERCCDLQDVFDLITDQEIPVGIKHFDEKRDLISGEHDWKVFGAIWTDKGLIYVAKMNYKGDLKLLYEINKKI